MEMKECAFSGCNNFVWNGKPSADFSMFDFPKKETIITQWVAIGKVNDYDPLRKYFMCSNHFDKKYISTNYGRLKLADSAIPNRYPSIGIDMNYIDGEKTNSIEKKFDEQDNWSLKEEGDKEKIPKSRDENDKKGMKDLNNSGEETLDMEPNDSVKTFMFKGIEYVEMRKSYFLQEKAKLMEELEHYKAFVNKVKSGYADFKMKKTN